jgi:predicted nucleic acid-binding protein
VSLLYLDTCCIIYLIEAASPFHAAVVRRVSAHNTIPGATLVSSRLARLECRSKPVREAGSLRHVLHGAAVQARGNLLCRGRVCYGPPSEVRIQTPDAIHLATAILERADAFLTGDAQLGKCRDIRVEVIT